MKIALASDHGGFELKNRIAEYLRSTGIEVSDLGTYSEEAADYPVWAKKCAEAVMNGEADKGIVFCGTGVGVSIAANKVKGARCALVTSKFMAEMAAAHNQANMLALGGRTTSFEDATLYVDTWIATPPDLAERHVRRVAMLDAM
ncbi:MAG: ribose 5-phosphate isomerase B [Clostridiales Family XIII bacterium]|jgi:ribose 5-phosphate isomerase B|nr:ribose 5-phosphate isomerase B [Clostridiales Family XIII bacterium]